MDFYLDFSRELEKSHSPEVTLQKMVERIKGVIEQEPARVALAKGTALLSVIHDYRNPQTIQILPTFRDIKESIELLLSALDADIDLEENLWKERSGGQYNEGPEDQPQEARRFLDFDGIETWGKARWVAFVAQVDMVTDIAATSPTGVESMAHLLTEIRNSFGRIPVEAQEQALIAADKLALAIREDMERTMDTLQDKHQKASVFKDENGVTVRRIISNLISVPDTECFCVLRDVAHSVERNALSGQLRHRSW